MSRPKGFYLPTVLFDSKAYKSLTLQQIRIYQEFLLKRQFQKKNSSKKRKNNEVLVITNNGKITFSYKEAEEIGFTKPTFRTAIDKLIEVGLIDIVAKNENGYNLFAISERWIKYGTNEFKKSLRFPDQYGYVYVIKSQGVYKIGTAKNIKKRLAKYITENPFPVEMVLSCQVDDCLNKEKHLLQLFASKNLHGEWFKLLAEDIETIGKYLRL